ncbi:MAG: hypothetical protein HOG24_07710, partial [Candidatus Cloacimonetes bacterium]|nr:hypothetical protein [Candidatus Cloacimonadota bacterium]
LSDVDGTSLWTMKALNESNWRREFFTSFKGITAILGYDKSNSIVWVDEQGELINRLEFQNRLVTEPKTIKNGEIWIIQRIPGYEYIPEPNVKSSLTFCDSRGNVINKVELKYLVLDNEIAISKSEDYLIYSCEDIRRTSKDSFQYCSYLLNYDGSVIKEFEDIMLTFGGDFSDNEDVYVDRGSKSYIVDIATGNIMGTYSTQGRSVVANKETGILAVLDHGVLRIINYKTKQVLFQERFEGYPHPTYLEITGDAKEVIATSKNHQYTFRMKE